MIGLIGRKIGMTQIVDRFGNQVPVTVVQAGPVTVTRIRTKSKDGYDALQVGFGDVEPERLPRPVRGYFEKAQTGPKRFLREFRMGPSDKADAFKTGQEIKADFFQEGDFVDVQARSIGKGFQGGVRRWGMKGGPETHGSMYHRRPGSGGCTTFPGRTWRGHHNPGHMGDAIRTVQNLLVMKVMPEDNTLLVRGAVPGSRNAVLVVKKSFKRGRLDLAALQAARTGEKKDAGKKAAPKKPAPKK